VIRRLLKFSRMLEDSERQALLDIDALQKAKQEATAADRAKLNFMSVVSHELRTPLTVILGYARLGKNIDRMPASETLLRELKTNSRDGDIATKCANDVLNLATTGMEKIERSGEHLLFLVNQLLDYAKMETGRLELDTEVCDVHELLEPVIDQMRVLTDQKGLNLRSSIHRCNLIADVTRTRQILINLLGNAIKFTDKGTVSVLVEETSQRVNISVSDTGPGIEKGELKKIFEAFHQADLSQSRNAAGTGLGLSVARELAKLENGTIDVTSEVGVGSTFTLSLPKDNEKELEQAA
jgi:signal transduction histidine kinase